jgi:hypothetical protein
MKCRLPRVTAIVVGFVFAFAELAAGQESTTEVEDAGLVARAAAQISQHPSLEAKIRQRVAIFDQYLVGSGTYQQLRDSTGNRFRLELRMPVGEQLTSLQHVNDGRYLWIRRDLGELQSLGRIDLRRVQTAMRASPPSAVISTPVLLGTGGLSELLRGLSDNFDFAPPEPEDIGGIPVWRVRGRWKTKALTRMFPEQPEGSVADREALIAKLPQHLPDHVALVLGRGGYVPLFPYRVEFFRRDAKTNRQRPMLAMELFEVQLRSDFQRRHFSFQLGEQRVEDETDAYLQKLGLSDDE